MKKKVFAVVAMTLILAMSLSIVAYADSDMPALEGNFTNGSVLGETVLSFDKDGTVQIRYLVGGNEVYNETARYAIDADETQLALTFRGTDGSSYTRVLSYDRAQHGVVIDETYYKLYVEVENAAA